MMNLYSKLQTVKLKPSDDAWQVANIAMHHIHG
jgi:hypothetical protein